MEEVQQDYLGSIMECVKLVQGSLLAHKDEGGALSLDQRNAIQSHLDSALDLINGSSIGTEAGEGPESRDDEENQQVVRVHIGGRMTWWKPSER